MVEMSEETTLNLTLRDIQEAGCLTNNQKTKMADVFGSRFTAAYEAIEEGKVKRYIFHPSGRVVWIVSGKERDYQILPLANFCSCFDFYFRVINREISYCYHLIAQKIARNLGWFEVIEENDELYQSLMNEWKKATA